VSDAVVKHLGSQLVIELATGEQLPVKPLSLPDGRELLDLWLTSKKPTPPEPIAVTAWREEATRAKEAGTELPPQPTGEEIEVWQEACAAIYRERSDATREITARFPAAVQLSAENERKLTHGDPMRLIPEFFYAGSGATLKTLTPATKTPAGASPTGTASLSSTTSSPA
jgi:hypothetical protein